MTCPQCGYVLTAFDLQCPRCQGLGLSQALSNPASASPAPSGSVLAGSTGTSTAGTPPAPTPAPSSIPSPSSAAPIPVPPSPLPSTPTQPAAAQPGTAQPGTVIPPHCCPHCQHLQIQKVSAIVQAGTWRQEAAWNEQTRIDTQSTAVGFGVAWGQNGSTPATTVSGGRTQGSGQSHGQVSTSGATDLARRLAPPPMPAPPVRYGKREFHIDRFLWSLFALVVIYGYYKAQTINFSCFLTLGAIALCFTWFALPSKGFTMAEEERLQEEQMIRWRDQMAIWNRLYYCPRCDQTFEALSS